MPVYDLGYRPYEGPRSGRWARWWPISRRCLRASLRWPFVVVLILGSFPLLIRLLFAYATGMAARPGRASGPGAEILAGIVNPWGFGDGLFFELISYEIFWVVLLLVVAGAGQIAEDFRTGALQIYFAKPITQLDYVIGKLGTVVLAALMLTLAPSVLLFLGVAAFAPDWSFLAENPWLPLKVLGFSLLVATVLGSVVLALSSLGRRGRMVGITFAGGYFFSMVLGKVLPRIFRDPRWEAVHVGNCLDAAGRSLFAEGPAVDAPAGAAWVVLGILVVGSMLVFTRKVNAVEVVS